MSSESTQVRLVRLVAITIGMTACVPRFVSLPSNLRADAQQVEYRTSAFTIRAPHGRWVTDSVMSVRNLRVRWTCETPYDSIVLAGVVDAYTDFGGNRTPLHVEQIRFYRVVRMQIVTDNPGLLSDADACITVTSYPLITHDSSAAAPKGPLGFYQTVQQDVRKLASSLCLWSDFWGGHASDGVGRFQELRVGERTFYYVALVSERDSTKFCEDHGVELLYAAQGRVFAVYVSSPGILDDALPVAETLTPRE
jgi:hypothetical protein